MTDEGFEAKVAELRERTEVERPVAEHDGWTFGERVRAIEDDDDNGIFAGAEGVLIIEAVGAAEYNSERVALFLLEDGMDSPNEVAADAIEPA